MPAGVVLIRRVSCELLFTYRCQEGIWFMQTREVTELTERCGILAGVERAQSREATEAASAAG